MRTSFGSIFSLNKWYTKPKEVKITDLQAPTPPPPQKKSLCHYFVLCTKRKNKTNIYFFGLIVGYRLLHGTSNFQKLGVKKFMKSSVAENIAVLHAWQTNGPLRPPPVQLMRVKQRSCCSYKAFRSLKRNYLNNAKLT